MPSCGGGYGPKDIKLNDEEMRKVRERRSKKVKEEYKEEKFLQDVDRIADALERIAAVLENGLFVKK